MPNCEARQALLLEYVFDLLDDGERRAVEAHLTECAACQAALARTQQQQRLLATAARLECPEVRFEAPVAEPVTVPETTPAVLPMPRRSAIRWRRWAVAAAILVAIGIPGWIIGRTASRYADARQEAQLAEAKITAENEKMRRVEADLRLIPQQRDAKVAAVLNTQRERQLKLVVTGPGTIQSGAPNEFQIQTFNLNNQPADAEIEVYVSTEADKLGKNIAVVPVEQKGQRKAGSYRLTLPADLPLRPGSRPTLLVHAKRDAGAQTELSETLELAHSAYVTHLATDKPMYQPGETVYFRSLTLDRFTLRPTEENFHLIYRISNSEVRDKVIASRERATLLADDPTGKNRTAVNGADGKPVHGIGSGALPLSDGVPGGEYVLSVEDALGRFPRQERRFIVNKYQKHVLNKELDFNRKTYGVGDEVQALCKANGVNGPVKNARVEATVLIDGKTYGADGKESNKPLLFQTDEQGSVTVRFKLPTAIDKGQATLSVKFEDGKVVETLPRGIPLVLKKLQLEFFPEGGDLVAGLPNRVYFQVRTTLGKPADLRGRLLQDGKPLDVVLQTLTDDKEPGVNQGMGRFEFTPKAGSVYAVQVDAPLGIADRYPLPDVKPHGVILRAPEGVVAAGQPIRVNVHTTKPRNLMIGAYCRGRLLDSVHLDKGQTEAVLKPTSGDGGVCRVTVFEETPANANRRELKPVAERLIYLQPVERLRVVLRPDRSNYVPGQPAKMTVEAFNEKDEPAAALVMLSVVDKSVLAMADEKTARTMPTHFLLTTEVRRSEDLEYADFLLGPHPRAAEALDLLLGTQGWRRFAEQNPTEFRKNLKDPGDVQEADRLLVSIGQSMPLTRDFAREEIDKVREDFNHKVDDLAVRYENAGQAVEKAQSDEGYKSAVATLATYQKTWDHMRETLFPALAALLVVAVLICFFLALAREPRRAVPYYLGMAGGTLLVAVLCLNWGIPRQHPAYRTVDDMAQVRDMELPAPGGAWWRRPAHQVRRCEGRGAAGADRCGGGGRERTAPKTPSAVAACKWRRGAKAGRKPAAASRRQAKAEWNGARPGRQNEEGRRQRDGDGELLAKVDGKEQAAFFGADKQAKRLKDAAMKPGAAMPPNLALGRQQEAEQLNRNLDDRARLAAAGANRGVNANLRQLAEGFAGRAERRQLPALVVREYAHKHEDKNNAAERADFTETLFWHPVLVLPGGKTDVSFALSDSVTRFQATAFAHTTDGRLGAASVVFDSKLPFTLHPKTPIEVTAGDKITLPVGIANNTGAASSVELLLKRHDGLELLNGVATEKFKVEGETARKFYSFRPTLKQGDAVLAFQAQTDGFAADSVRTTFRIVPEGFPRAGSISDTLEGSATQTVKLPDEWIAGTLQANVQVFPSTMADLQKGLESLLREPGGCFEQTSTSSYPNVLILDYLDSSKQAKPEVEKHARELLGRGYQKLTSFECQNSRKQQGREGYEWFGGNAPPHEALTAYGLLQFRDMARFQEVDPAMIKRTQAYLMSRRDQKGGFLRNDRALDTFGRASKPITDAYIVWAMTEAGCDDSLKTELDALLALGKGSKDPYFLSLVANGLINKGRTAEAIELLKIVVGAQQNDGHLDGLEMSITSSRGKDLQVETTALAVLGWLKANPGEFNKPVKKAVDWIGKQRGGYGGFGSTQSTILALKALIAHTRLAPRETKGGTLTIFVGDKQVATTTFKPGVSDTIVLPVPNVEQWLKQGDNKVRVEMTGGNVLPFTLSWTYQTMKPADTGDCPLRLETTLGKGKTSTTAKEGEVVRLTATLKNTSKDGQGMAVAIIGLPGGLTIPEDMKQLKEYAKIPEDGSRPLIAAFEVRGRDLVLYWRDLKGGQEIEVPIDLVCRVPGEYTGPASRAYLYYNAESKCWIDPLSASIVPAE